MTICIKQLIYARDGKIFRVLKIDWTSLFLLFHHVSFKLTIFETLFWLWLQPCCGSDCGFLPAAKLCILILARLAIYVFYVPSTRADVGLIIHSLSTWISAYSAACTIIALDINCRYNAKVKKKVMTARRSLVTVIQ